MSDEMKSKTLADAALFGVGFYSTTDGHIPHEDVFLRYKEVGEGEKYDIKDVFRSGGVLYWKNKQ